ncbi:MAG TPA: glutamine synthetase family protein [Verrucomicrobiae bacterium]|nr:glutamine synthetase family protein [Verrucomicrobiae bacterium]
MGERLRLLFCDHLNLARGKYLPASKIGDGSSRFCQGVFAIGYDKDLLAAPGSKMLEGLPDMDAVYRAADIREGWEPDTKVVVADLAESGGAALPLCGRSLLKRTVRQWQALGYSPRVGLELEAYAFQRDGAGRLVPYDTPGAYVYGTGRLADPLRFTDAIWSKAAEAGLRMDSLTSEYDSPQFEFTLAHDDPVKAVDEAFLFRLLAREIALDHGIILTFMPKPIPGKSGSGLHANLSFLDKDGRNALGEGRTPETMTPLIRGSIAGLLHHHRGMAGLLAPTVNSYERLRPASLSGYWRNWGVDHRGATTRLSAEGGARARIEHRMGDGAANPYTAVAVVLQAARLGLAGGYELPPAETGDCIGRQDAEEGTPDSLAAALEALAADHELVAAVGAALVENHIFVKRHEIEKTASLEGDSLRDFYIYYV